MLRRNVYKSFKNITIITTFFGLYKLIEYFNYKIPPLYSTILFIIIAAIILTPFINLLNRPIVSRLFGVLTTENVIQINKKYKIKVLKDGRPHITSTRELIFIKQPKIGKFGELFDLVSMDRNIPLKKVKKVLWRTSDADEIHTERKEQNKVIIYWKPKSSIKLFSPFIHTFRTIPFTSFNDPANYFEIYRECPAAHIELLIETRKKIEYGIAFKNPRKFKKDIDKYKYALNLKNPLCPAPKIEGTKLFWKIDNPEIGAVYTICFFYEGGIDYIKKIIEEENCKKLIPSIKQWVKQWLE